MLLDALDDRFYELLALLVALRDAAGRILFIRNSEGASFKR
jgi:hypothetical protein